MWDFKKSPVFVKDIDAVELVAEADSEGIGGGSEREEWY